MSSSTSLSFIVPKKITSKLPISRFKTIDESRDFLLQQRKKAFQSIGKTLYRIETREKKNNFHYEIANGDDLNILKDNQWRYINIELPLLVPEKLTGKDRIYWLISHFTQLALGGNVGSAADIYAHNHSKSDVDIDENASSEDESENEDVIKRNGRLSSSAGNLLSPNSNRLSIPLNTTSIIPTENTPKHRNMTLQEAKQTLMLSSPLHSLNDTTKSKRNSYQAVLSPIVASPLNEDNVSVPSRGRTGTNASSSVPDNNNDNLLISNETHTVASVLLPADKLLKLLQSVETTKEIHHETIVKIIEPGLFGFWNNIVEKYGSLGGILILFIANSIAYLMYLEPKFALGFIVLLNIIGLTNLKASPPVERILESTKSISKPITTTTTKHEISTSSQITSPNHAPVVKPVASRSSSKQPTKQPIKSVDISDSEDEKQEVKYSGDVTPPPRPITISSPPVKSVPVISSPSALAFVTPTNVPPPVAVTSDPSTPPSPRPIPKKMSNIPPPYVPISQELFQNWDDNKLQLGKTIKYSPDQASGTWSYCEGETFSVRIGPNYKTNKKKALSKPSMCELLGVDCWSSDFKIDNIARYINLPTAPILEECEKNDIAQPPLFIVNCQVPSYAPPGMFGASKTDGRGFNLVLYYQFLPEYKADWHKGSIPSVGLVRRFIEAELDEVTLHERMKAICRITNIQESTLSSATKTLTTQYNSTPFLTRPQHKFFRGDNYFEIDIDVHIFGYMARTGLYGVIDQISSVIFDYAFIIEGHTDAELPEQILGCVRMSKLNVMQAAEFPIDLIDPSERPTLD